MAGPYHINIYRSRKKGYLKAMHESGVDVPPSWILTGSLIQEGGELALRKGMAMKKKPDAYFCSGDFAALSIIQAAKREGIAIPDELGVSGFANEPFTAFLEPSMTTVDQGGEIMIRMVTGMFLNCEKNQIESGSCKQLVLNPRLIVRSSS